jgi:pimeloyl-ACP methyl ester carboxylesterase
MPLTTSPPFQGPARTAQAGGRTRTVVEGDAHDEVWRRTLLLSGIASSLLFAAMIWLIRYEGYSPISQTPSELTAIGAPTRPLWSLLGTIYTLLVGAFGWGILRFAGRDRAVRIVGGLILAYASLGLLWPFAAMHQREVLAAGGGTPSDTAHVVLSAVTVIIMFLAIGFGAPAFGRRFRLYSIASVIVLLAFGAMTFLEAPRVQANLPTPWIGLWERINISVFLLWIVVLATVLLRSGTSTERRAGPRPSPFKTPEGEAGFLAAYDAALKLWPVPYEQLDVPTRFGTTHVIAAGPADAPALVLLHGYMATSVMWSFNVADFVTSWRVYAIDIMGQPSQSIPKEPIRDEADYVAWLTDTLDALNLDRPALAGMSYGGRVALIFAIAAPARVSKLVLLSPGGLLPLARQFTLRGMLMAFFPTRATVRSFMRWAGFTETAGAADATPVLDLMYLGQKHFRMPAETLRAAANAVNPLPDDDLRALHVPVLLLIGEDEVLYDAPAALARARRLIPGLEGELIPNCRHDMCVSQHRIVDARVVDFLRSRRDWRTHDSVRLA